MIIDICVVTGLLCAAPGQTAPILPENPVAAEAAIRTDTVAFRTAVQARLDALHEAGRFPGVSVGFALADGTMLGVRAGTADPRTDEPLTRDSRFLAGSVGKTFFAALALQLAQEGRLDLDAPIGDFLGGEPWFHRLPNARDITVRMLMNHTSGLVRYEFDPAVTSTVTAEPDKVWTPENRLAYVLDTDPPFAAGEGWEYSDTNFIVLAMITERILGADAYDEIQRRFIDPLGLRNTVPSDRREIPGLVQGYAGPENPFGEREYMLETGALVFNPQLEWAGGGYASSPVDLAVWARALFGGEFHDPAMIADMVDGVPTAAPALRYGLGVMVRETSLGSSHGHGGFFPGYLSEMRYYPELGLAVGVQFNSSVPDDLGISPAELAHELAELAVQHGLTQH